MKNLPTLIVRHPERGAVAMLVAFMWTALFGMAVLAVDFGYLYTKRRGVQAVADAAVKSAMPLYKTSGYAAAAARAVQVAGLNNYSNSGNTTVQTDEPVAGSQFRVRVSRRYPTFFGSLFGLGARTVTGTTVGKLTAAVAGGGAAAIYSSDPGCAAQFGNGGVSIGGSGRLVVNGDIATLNNKIELASWDLGCATPGTCKVTGTANSPCAVYNDSPANLSIGTTAATPTPDPLIANTVATLAPFCTVGTFGAPLSLTPYWNPEVGGCNGLPNGVYCSDGSGMTVAPPGPGKTICPSTVTFMTLGSIQINADGNIALQPAPTAPNGILVFANGVGAGCGVPAIQISNGSGTPFYTMSGNVYAPNGCINIGSNTLAFTSNGIIDGRVVNIAMGPGMLWTFNGPGGGGGGGGGGSWSLIQ